MQRGHLLLSNAFALVNAMQEITIHTYSVVSYVNRAFGAFNLMLIFYIFHSDKT